MIPDNWRVRLKVNDQGWTQHPSVWVAVSPRAAERRPTAFKAATRGIFKVEQKLREEYNKKMAQHMPRSMKHGRPQAKKERGQEPKPPAEVRLATDDFTPEVLCDLLQSSTKVLLRSDELATVLGAYERYQKAGTINAGPGAHAGALRRRAAAHRSRRARQDVRRELVGRAGRPYPAGQGPASS